MKRLFLVIATISLVYACGTNPSSQDAAGAEEHMNHEGHDHGTPAATTNELPAVPAGARVFFANLEDGAEVSSPLYVAFGVEGIEVEPAGVVNEGKGHHHIIIDSGYIESGVPVPANETNIHYGGGQTGDTLTLSPGKHVLTLQFADGLHRSYGRAMSASVSVMVK